MAVKRIVPSQCCGVIIDVQDFFLDQVEKRARARIKVNTRNYVRLLDYFRAPMVATLERPVEHKGTLPKEIAKPLGERAQIFEKDYFDLTKEKPIRDHLARLKRKQMIVAGCETDVCVLQSCLGLLGLGYQVFLVEELLFSSARDVDAAVTRLNAAGAVFLSYKTLFYEMIEAVDGGRHGEKLLRTFGDFPEDVPDAAVA
ncbi:MAG: isochorismatase family protein [Xanthobacteraceae bacterium]